MYPRMGRWIETSSSVRYTLQNPCRRKVAGQTTFVPARHSHEAFSVQRPQSTLTAYFADCVSSAQSRLSQSGSVGAAEASAQ